MPTNANSPAGPSIAAVSTAAGRGSLKARAQREEDRRLQHHQPGDAAEHQQRLPGDLPDVDAHADREEEDAQQEGLEGLDDGLDDLAVLGLRQQEPGDECAERHRDAGDRRKHPRADDDEQRDRQQQFGGVGRGHEPIERAQHRPSEHDDQRQRRGGLPQRRDQARGDGNVSLHGEDGDQQQDRHDGEILRQQDRERGAPARRCEPALAGQELDADGRGGEGEARTEDGGGSRLLAHQRDGEGQDERGDADLRHAEPEHLPPHRHQAGEGEFQADQEQQEHHAELGDARHVGGIDDRQPVERGDLVDERAEAERPQRGARSEIAQDRIDAEAADQRHHDAGRPQHDERVAVDRNVDGVRHRVSCPGRQRPGRGADRMARILRRSRPSAAL